jgi:hypothetical protein
MLRLDPVHVRETNLHRSGATRRLRPMLQMLTTVTTLLCLSAVAACGGDDSGEGTETTAGSGGKAAGSGGGGSSGSTTPPPPMPVACGTTQCNPPANPLSGILGSFGGGAFSGLVPTPQACCLDEGAGTCGVTIMGGACEALAVVDTRCPKANLGMLGGLVNIQPCCLDNQCGQDGRLFGRGCVENTQVAGMLGPLAQGGGFMLPGSQACDAPAPTPDAGTSSEDDAGAPTDDSDAGT